MYLIALKVLEKFQSYAIDCGQVCVRMPNPQHTEECSAF